MKFRWNFILFSFFHQIGLYKCSRIWYTNTTTIEHNSTEETVYPTDTPHEEHMEQKNGKNRFTKPSDFRRSKEEQKNIAATGMVAGRNAVRELLTSGRDIDKIYVQKGDREGSIVQLIGEITARKIPLVEVEKTRLNDLAGSQAHQGIVAMAAEHAYASVEDILAYAAQRGEKPVIVFLDGVEDPHNLGAILRSAECMGAHGVVLPKRRSVGLTAVVAKTSAGAIEHMRVARVPNLTQTIKELKEQGMWFYAADMDGQPYMATDFSSPVGLVLGGEGNGISHLVKQTCDFVVSIPQYGQVNSMNVSCAAAVLLSEIARQRHA